MKKKHTICRLLALAVAIFLITHSAVTAIDKVVVIPLDSGNCDCDAISTVTSANQVWMDRNLVALRVATSSTDYHAYGYLFQWGRLADGHEIRSSTTETLISDDVPGHGDFIITSLPPYDWRVPQKEILWQGVSGINNPCPDGFRLPTETEWETEWVSWGSNDSTGAFVSPLKLSFPVPVITAMVGSTTAALAASTGAARLARAKPVVSVSIASLLGYPTTTA